MLLAPAVMHCLQKAVSYMCGTTHVTSHTFLASRGMREFRLFGRWGLHGRLFGLAFK